MWYLKVCYWSIFFDRELLFSRSPRKSVLSGTYLVLKTICLWSWIKLFLVLLCLLYCATGNVCQSKKKSALKSANSTWRKSLGLKKEFQMLFDNLWEKQIVLDQRVLYKKIWRKPSVVIYVNFYHLSRRGQILYEVAFEFKFLALAGFMHESKKVKQYEKSLFLNFSFLLKHSLIFLIGRYHLPYFLTKTSRATPLYKFLLLRPNTLFVL